MTALRPPHLLWAVALAFALITPTAYARPPADPGAPPGSATSLPAIAVPLPALDPPANDDFGSPTVVSGLPYVATQSTAEATTAVDDPWPIECQENAVTVWYAYTPAFSTPATANTFGSDYNTCLSALDRPKRSDKAVGAFRSVDVKHAADRRKNDGGQRSFETSGSAIGASATTKRYRAAMSRREGRAAHAIERLPELERLVFTYFAYEKLEDPEIAELLDLTEKTSRSCEPRRRNASPTLTGGRTSGQGLSARSSHTSSNCTASSQTPTDFANLRPLVVTTIHDDALEAALRDIGRGDGNDNDMLWTRSRGPAPGAGHAISRPASMAANSALDNRTAAWSTS